MSTTDPRTTSGTRCRGEKDRRYLTMNIYTGTKRKLRSMTVIHSQPCEVLHSERERTSSVLNNLLGIVTRTSSIGESSSSSRLSWVSGPSSNFSFATSYVSKSSFFSMVEDIVKGSKWWVTRLQQC